VDNNLRCDANILVETASVRDPHHFAVLLGFGATAIYPYLAYETLAKQVEEGLKMSLRQAMLNYRNGINKGLYKVMSKMGISTVASYRCSQLFEAVGSPAPWSNSASQRIEPHSEADFADIQQDQINLSRLAWLGRKPLTQGGLLKFVHGGEYTPTTRTWCRPCKWRCAPATTPITRSTSGERAPGRHLAGSAVAQAGHHPVALDQVEPPPSCSPLRLRRHVHRRPRP
jgi:glutamate synthase (NADPH/NADH) large chain